MNTEDDTIRALKIVKQAVAAIPPEQRQAFLIELTAVCIMACQGAAGIAFTNGLMAQAKTTPCPFKIDFDREDE